jgi:hypothetical protein
VTAEQAVALLVNGRADDIRRYAEAHAGVPSLSQAKESPEWRWRFVGALGHRIATGEVGELLSAVADAPDPATRAAATVTAASGLLEEGRADEALVSRTDFNGDGVSRFCCSSCGRGCPGFHSVEFLDLSRWPVLERFV